MTAKDALKHMLQSNQHMVKMYIADLSDADLLVRPAPNANHIAWQLGHLISSEAEFFLPMLAGAKQVELPAGFTAAHTKETAAKDTGFKTKQEYLDLHAKVRAATVAALEEMPESQLDRPTPGDMAKYAPTLGTLFALVANHDMMHAGQFTVTRRKLGKPVLF